METQEERKKNVAFLKSTQEMLEKTLQQSQEKGNIDAVKLIEVTKKDVEKQMNNAGVKVESKTVNEVAKTETIKETKTELEKVTVANETNYQLKEKTNKVVGETSNINLNQRYDMIPLPSNGEVYTHKKEMLPVGYLTANDENTLIEPNMYVNGLIFDTLLKNKILDKDIDPEDLIKADRDQIILWLRMTSYGPEFPIVATDPDSGEKFDTVVDLSKIKAKPFTLKGDEKGWFEFKVPSGDIIKFTYPTRKEEREYEKYLEVAHKAIQQNKFNMLMGELYNLSSTENVLLDDSDKEYLMNVRDGLNSIYKKLDLNTEISYPKIITKRLAMKIKSVNGTTDKEFINAYCDNMLARDALVLRDYMDKNEPMLDFEITIDKPESLGGGSFTTFLEIGVTLFFNIADL